MTQNMHIFSWDKNLETGIQLIDDQHKSFFKHANRFIIKVLMGKSDEGIKEEYEFVKDYLQYHFQAEETFMADSRYPDYRVHQAEHLQLVFKTKAIERLILEESGQKVVEDFTAFIKDWVINHILDSDMKFSNYYNRLEK